MKKLILMLAAVVLLLLGCVKKMEPTPQTPLASAQSREGIAADLASVKEQSALIEASLEEDDLTQSEMNEKSKALYDLWDGALARLLDALKANLPKAEFALLQQEQKEWSTQREKAMEEAGREFAGGSLYALIVNSEGAGMTQERVHVLESLLK